MQAGIRSNLKIMPFRRYITQLPKPLTIMLGMDWKEQQRLEAPRKASEALGYQVDYPLMWKPWELRPYQDVIREEWGIEPPRLYAMGFPHNNCGGQCIKQGVKEWLSGNHLVFLSWLSSHLLVRALSSFSPVSLASLRCVLSATPN